jgi:type VI secretion system protein ImpC
MPSAPATTDANRCAASGEIAPPTVKITYDICTGGVKQERELPFVIGILADLSGVNRAGSAFKHRVMRDVDRHQFDEVLRAYRPGLDLSVVDNLLPHATTPKLSGVLTFEKLADFDAPAVMARIPELARAFENPDAHALASRQLSLIVQCPAFQALEATWRSLHRLVSSVNTGPLLQIRVLDASRDELLDDLAKAVDLEQSNLYQRICEDELGTFGGRPYSLLVGAYQFGADPASVEGLRHMASLSAQAHAPFITAAAPAFFGMDSYTDLHKPRALRKIFESPEYLEWNRFRSSEDARYVGLVLPGVLVHAPLASDEPGGEAGAQTERLLWGNPAFLLAETIASAFARNQWPAGLRGVESGGLVSQLTYFCTRGPSGEARQIGPVEASISDRRLSELSALGFIPLCQRKDSDQAAFFCVGTAARPQSFLSEEAHISAHLACSLPAVLTGSRFVHYIKVMLREKIGTFMTRSQTEAYLNDWLSGYVLLDDEAPPEVQARYPLRAASVRMEDSPGAPGTYRAEVLLQPGFQIGSLSHPIRFVAQLPA